MKFSQLKTIVNQNTGSIFHVIAENPQYTVALRIWNVGSPAIRFRVRFDVVDEALLAQSEAGVPAIQLLRDKFPDVMWTGGNGEYLSVEGVIRLYERHDTYASYIIAQRVPAILMETLQREFPQQEWMVSKMDIEDHIFDLLGEAKVEQEVEPFVRVELSCKQHDYRLGNPINSPQQNPSDAQVQTNEVPTHTLQ